MPISIHVPREGNDWLDADFVRPLVHFNPRSPRGERPSSGCFRRRGQNFNPRSPRGERLVAAKAAGTAVLFQSTFPARGTTLKRRCPVQTVRISIHVPREGNDQGSKTQPVYSCISIHVPREGNDLFLIFIDGGPNISIHVPREGNDRNGQHLSRITEEISIHVPREGNDRVLRIWDDQQNISIHVPREGNVD